jgi:hypothetical protein
MTLWNFSVRDIVEMHICGTHTASLMFDGLMLTSFEANTMYDGIRKVHLNEPKCRSDRFVYAKTRTWFVYTLKCT